MKPTCPLPWTLLAAFVALAPPVAPASEISPKPTVPIALSRRSLPNGCLVDAIVYRDAIEAKNRLDKRWSRVLLLQWQEKTTVKGHALCVFEFNKSIWAYDPASGTIPLTTDLHLKTNADELAKLWLGRNHARLLWTKLH